jgi:heme/copper-type cytochrome/quinol oxidase subunit 2
MKSRWLTPAVLRRLGFMLIVAAVGALGFLLAPAVPAPQELEITVRAHQYGYDPGVIRVNRGDTIRLRLVSDDVVHGFYLEGYDLDATVFPMHSTFELRRPSQPESMELVEEIVFSADREGKFRFRCSHTCGFMHPFMLGELIVGPNRLLPVSIGLALGVLVAGFVIALVKGEQS